MSDTTPQPNAYHLPGPMSPADQRLWATLTHVAGVLFVFLGFIPALIAYLVLKDRGGFIRAHTATALNFQLTMLIAYVAGSVLSLVGIGLLLVLVVPVLTIIFGIIAAVKANKGELYKYPLSIPFFS